MRKKLKGKVSWMGIALGAVLSILFVLIMCPMPHHGYHSAKATATLSNVKQLCLASLIYAADYDEHLPPDFSTNQDLRNALGRYQENERVFTSINEDPATILGNGMMAGIDLRALKTPAEAVMLFESKDWELNNRRILGFADGHAKSIEGFNAQMLEVALMDSTE